MDLKKKNVANNEAIGRYHNCNNLGKRQDRAVVVGMALIIFSKKNVWGLIGVKVKKRVGSRMGEPGSFLGWPCVSVRATVV